jgi:hypothetical protein
LTPLELEFFRPAVWKKYKLVIHCGFAAKKESEVRGEYREKRWRRLIHFWASGCYELTCFGRCGKNRNISYKYPFLAHPALREMFNTHKGDSF